MFTNFFDAIEYRLAMNDKAGASYTVAVNDVPYLTVLSHIPGVLIVSEGGLKVINLANVTSLKILEA